MIFYKRTIINVQCALWVENFIIVKIFFFCSTATKFMITTGDPQSSARKTEIVDVMSGLTCSELADFPVGTENAVGANLDGTPVICGGGDSSGYSERCYRLKNGIWEEFASMKVKRGYAAAVMYNNKLHVFGGQSSSTGYLIAKWVK